MLDVQTASTKPQKPLLGPLDLHLFNEGTHARLYEVLGAHLSPTGATFAVWAPNAEQVSVIGDFNGWTPGRHPLAPQGSSGLWTGQLEGLGKGALYKFHIRSRHARYSVEKTDPFGFYQEPPPRTASVLWSGEHAWGDEAWMRTRARRSALDAPISIYELHLGSWQRLSEEGDRWLSYRELAPRLIRFLTDMGYTHVELMPCTEHPFYGSWGYQTTGYFAPSARYGAPEALMFLIDQLHQAGLGVILDWVPSHFPTDQHGLAYFDGTHLYEHADPRQGFHPDWASAIFNYERNEVRSFLLSSVCFWLDRFHIDGIRVDAVASMLYLDYSRKDGQWIPNRFGGRENLGAIAFLRQMNQHIHERFKGVLTIAEESTAWPMVSRSVDIGGLGFDLKWDMGWMHDTLRYLAHDPVHRKYHHNELTFRMLYYANESFVLPLSHDEVTHGKGSLLSKMPGDEWQRFANLRLLYGYMWTAPGKKLLFMGGDMAQAEEWAHEGALRWEALERPLNRGVQTWVRDLNRVYRTMSALHARDCDPRGFEWIDCSDHENSIIAFYRRGHERHDAVIVVLNFTPVPRSGYRIGVDHGGGYRVLLNSDAECYGGSNYCGPAELEAEAIEQHGRPFSLSLALPPLGMMLLARPSAR